MLKATSYVFAAIVAASFVVPAEAERAPVPPRHDSIVSPLQLKPAHRIERFSRRVADAGQCDGQTQPVIACTCLANDADGNCIQESCETVCDGTE